MRSQFESTYLSENLSDLFRKQRLWLVRDDIICNYKHGADHGADDNINAIYRYGGEVQVISLSRVG